MVSGTAPRPLDLSPDDFSALVARVGEEAARHLHDLDSALIRPSTTGSESLELFGGPEDAERLREWFAKLSEGGVVRQPLEAAPWGDEFGMLTDRFGIGWLVNIAGASS